MNMDERLARAPTDMSVGKARGEWAGLVGIP